MVPLTAVLAAAASVIATLALLSARSRIHFARQPDSFRCRLGAAAVPWRGGARWQRRRTRAVWVSDVLLVETGLLRLSATPVAAHLARDVEVESLSAADVPGLGPHPVALRLTDRAGRWLEIAAAEPDRTLLVGPFLVAAVPGLPKAPRDGRGA